MLLILFILQRKHVLHNPEVQLRGYYLFKSFFFLRSENLFFSFRRLLRNLLFFFFVFFLVYKGLMGKSFP
nr:MAG TPA: hypothetical protein [Caudoviricetes sp.]